MRAEDLLPDGVEKIEVGGVTIRKGSIGAFLVNAMSLRKPDITSEERAALLRDIEQALPILRALRLFDVMEIRDPELRAFVEARL